MNKKVICISLISLSIFIVGCGNKPIATPQEPTKTNIVAAPKNTTAVPKKTTPVVEVKKPTKVIVDNYNNISKRTKDFILNGQGNIPDASKIIWDDTLLNRVNIENLYKQYLSKGNNKNDIKAFAWYVTLNAPIQSDWKVLFEKVLYKEYGYKVSKYVFLGNTRYQAYIIYNGKEVPYVVIDSRTGRFHG
jgi:hypothetical protein